MINVVIVILTLIAVYNVLRLFGVFEFTKQQEKVIVQVKESSKLRTKRHLEQAKLNFYRSFTHLFSGILLSELAVENHRYYIERLDLRSEILNRRLLPEEVIGQYSAPFMISLLLVPVYIFVQPIILIPILFGIRFFTYQTIFKSKIRDEDEIIDNYFIDLYLLLYSKLRQGSRARLQGTIEGQADTEVNKVMLRLAKYFLNLLSLYEDHVAVPMLRYSYRSATIVNFCNIATQALNGVDNFDNLLTFRMQLVERKTNMMRERQKRILRSGERSIYAIWVILFIFIVVGWYSKLPTGFF